MKQHNSEGMLH